MISLRLALALALSFSLTPSLARAAPLPPSTVGLCADAAERGQELRATQKLVSAREHFVTCAQRTCPTAIQDACTEWLTDLDRRLPSIVIGAKNDRGEDVRDVTATLDGLPLPNVVTSAAVSADPGPHTLRCEAPGYEPVTTDIVLREGELLRLVAITLKPPAGPSAVQDIAGPPPSPPPARPRPFPVLPVALGGASVIALGIFAVAAATGASDYHSLESECSPHCSSDRIDSVRTRFVVADVALVAGIVMGASAIGLWLFDRPAARDVRR